MAQQSMETRAERRRLRERRLAIPREERVSAERAIAKQLARMHLIRRGSRIAAYLAMPGEASLDRVIESAHATGATVWVPRITSRRRAKMRFCKLAPGAPLRRNARAFGIREPATGALTSVSPIRLDVVLVPLVGFDRAGHRLGMGAGFYDRALRGRRDRTRVWRRPRLIGIAYACQEVAHIEPAEWDVTLDAIVTERGLIVPRGRSPEMAARSPS